MNSIELFSGVGGLGMGLSRARFKPVLVVDKDLSCCETMLANQKNGLSELIDWPIIHSDVKIIDFKPFQDKIDLVAGGPPCQPFSLGGKHLGDLDSRNSFPQTFRAIREIKPKAFIFENVRGLIRKKFSNYFEYILLQLSYPELVIKKHETLVRHLRRLEEARTKGRYSGLSYNVVFNVLNAADFGLPQIRERIFFVGFRSDSEVNWHFPEPTHSYEALYRSKVKGTYWDRHKISNKMRDQMGSDSQISMFIDENLNTLPWLTVRDATYDLPDPERFPEKAKTIINHTFQPGARSYKGHNGSLLDYPSKTLKAGSHGVPGGENAIRKMDGSLRYFTIRESARLQGFPDKYTFNCSWGKAMSQIGNAVPVSLAEILGNSIRNAIRLSLKEKKAN